MMIDAMAKRYGKLPHEILTCSNTLDLYIMDIAISFENFHNKKTSSDIKDQYSTTQLIEIFKKAQNGKSK